MPASALALVLAAACLHAAWNLLLHGSPDRPAVMTVAGLVGGMVLAPWLVAEPPWRGQRAVPRLGRGAGRLRGFPVRRLRQGGAVTRLPGGPGKRPAAREPRGDGRAVPDPVGRAAAGAACLAAGLVLLGAAGRGVSGPAVLVVARAVLTGS